MFIRPCLFFKDYSLPACEWQICFVVSDEHFCSNDESSTFLGNVTMHGVTHPKNLTFIFDIVRNSNLFFLCSVSKSMTDLVVRCSVK